MQLITRVCEVCVEERGELWRLAVAQWVGFKAKPGREIAVGQCGRFRSAYLEVIIRVSGFIFPGIAAC